MDWLLKQMKRRQSAPAALGLLLIAFGIFGLIINHWPF